MVDKILVTGSLGQIGSYLCEDFMKHGMDVVGLDNRSNKYVAISRESEKITIIGDVRNKKLVSGLFDGIDAIVHCAAQISVEDSIKNPIYDAENNIVGTINLLEAATKSPKLKRFVYLSSAATYGNPISLPIAENHPQNPLSPYGLSKVAGEKYVNIYHEIYKLPTVIIRPFNVYSKRMDPKSPYCGVISKFLHRIMVNKSPLILGDGKQTRDFIHVNDVVRMIRVVLEKKEAIGETFNCGCGKPITINKLAEEIVDISGKNLKSIHIKGRIGDIKHSYADTRKAKKLLKIEPKIELRTGLKELVSSI